MDSERNFHADKRIRTLTSYFWSRNQTHSMKQLKNKIRVLTISKLFSKPIPPTKILRQHMLAKNDAMVILSLSTVHQQV